MTSAADLRVRGLHILCRNGLSEAGATSVEKEWRFRLALAAQGKVKWVSFRGDVAFGAFRCLLRRVLKLQCYILTLTTILGVIHGSPGLCDASVVFLL